MSSRREGSPPRGGARLGVALFAGLVLAGAIAFGVQVSGAQAPRAWLAYLVNFVFWSGLAFGAVLLSAVLTLTGARWVGRVRRLCEAFGAFLPTSFLLFWGLWFGRSALFPSLETLAPARRLWLDPAFLFPRDGAALGLLTASGVALVAASLRRDRCAEPCAEGRSTATATVFAVLYAVVLSLLAFDWIMSLDPHWVSTLFGAYYFVGSFYAGLSAVAVVAGLSANPLGIASRQSQDLGTLMLAFAFVTGYLFYVQFLVIWYGNVPAETTFLVLRLRSSPWAGLAWTVFAAGFGVPVAVLLFRKAKARPRVLAAVGCVALVGLWLERFLLVVPSLSSGPRLPLGPPEVLVTSGFFGLVALSVLAFLGRFGPAPGEPPPTGRAGEESLGRG